MEAIVTKQMQFTPKYYGHESCLPGHSYGPMVRFEYLIHYVVSGCGIFKTHGNEYTVNPGEMFVVTPGEEYYYRADEKTPWSYIWIGFSSSEPLPFDDIIDCCEAGKIFEEIKNCEHQQAQTIPFLTARIWDLYALLSNQNNYATKYIDEALDIIHTCYMNELSVSIIADKLNLSRNHLTLLFKEKIGVTPKQYLINFRMKTAADLLTVYQKSIAVVAASVGYPDPFVFSRTFKSHFGVSPKQYIQMLEKPTRSFNEFKLT